MDWIPANAARIDTFPTPAVLGRVGRAEALGFELFLPNGITRAGWLSVVGTHLGPDTTEGESPTRWSWELWPWPRAFLARLACTRERGVWRDEHGRDAEWCRHPPSDTYTSASGNGDVYPRPWRVDRHEGDTTAVVARLVPRSLTTAHWDWLSPPTRLTPPWSVIWSFRAVGV